MIISDIKEYLPENGGGGSLNMLATSKEIGAVRVLLYAVEKFRDKIRESTEGSPKHTPDNLKTDLIYLLGMVNALNVVLELPELAKEQLRDL